MTRTYAMTLAIMSLGVLCAGCSQGAKLTRETPTGGVVTFPYQKEGDRMSSPYRTEALSLIEQKCGKTYQIAREGEVARVNAVADRAWRGQMSGDRLWGIEFTCH